MKIPKKTIHKYRENILILYIRSPFSFFFAIIIRSFAPCITPNDKIPIEEIIFWKKLEEKNANTIQIIVMRYEINKIFFTVNELVRCFNSKKIKYTIVNV